MKMLLKLLIVTLITSLMFTGVTACKDTGFPEGRVLTRLKTFIMTVRINIQDLTKNMKITKIMKIMTKITIH